MQANARFGRTIVMSGGMMLVAALFGCVATSGSYSGHCTLPADDARYANGSPLYLECAVDRPAIPARARVESATSVAQASGQQCSVAEVRFVVGRDGVPEAGTARIVHTNDDVFARTILAGVPGWRYRPALIEGMPVRQVVQERRSAVPAATSAGTETANGGRSRVHTERATRPCS